MRTENEWTIAKHSDLMNLVGQLTVSEVAEQFGVSSSTVSSWVNGRRAPNRRFQLAIVGRVTNFGNLSPSQVGVTLNQFLDVNGLDVGFLAERLNVTERTAQAYLDGERRPRAIRQVASLLSTPTPV